MDTTRFIIPCIRAALDAGIAARKIYDQDFTVEKKADDSPITLADRRSHAIIKASLKNFQIPVLSEEGRAIAYDQRSGWEYLWIVDPLDGTKEFVKKNGEFTINIALVQHGAPVMGVIYVPITRMLYFAEQTMGAFRFDLHDKMDGENENAGFFDYDLSSLLDTAEKLPVKQNPDRPYTVVGSRSHSTDELVSFVEEIKKEHADARFISAGSSLKFCLVAEGAADIYPRLGPTMEWDTAAGDLIARASGAVVFAYDSQISFRQGAKNPLVYNKENLLNPWFVVMRK
ncbi:MAG: 3'(2'),5'-bisphosphate nucleotidase CysQ [Deltaproteobacteria bacterium]|nr:3'(2'),5'-bisphosphate nucleotidase CysQ [Deltaproteobacteria bacterium]